MFMLLSRGGPRVTAVLIPISIAFLALTVRLAATEPDSALIEFRLPHLQAFRMDPEALTSPKVQGSQWLTARPEGASTNIIEFGSRVVLQLNSPNQLSNLLSSTSLKLARTITPTLFILQAPDAPTAVREAQGLSKLRNVSAAYPVLKAPAALHGSYAPEPADSLFGWQWNLENRTTNGTSAGVDLNVRAAWPYTLGNGITIAIADTGVELQHPELASRTAAAPHYNFAHSSTNVGPVNDYYDGAHGTEVAGLAAAAIGSARLTGVAPGAQLASWVIFHTNGTRASDEELMDMFQYQSNVVQVQNHSWGTPGFALAPLTPLEDAGVSNAVTFGRFAKGSVLVRSAGNSRPSLINANYDGYTADPRVIPVAAVRKDGRVASYSQPGANVLVAAPSGDSQAGFEGLFTTDLLGTRGANQINFFPPFEDLSGYVFEALAFSGTSAAVPQISGLAALVLSANTNLSYRDVQQILLLSSRHFDLLDPDLLTNGAGFRVSHNVGFGVPDAGLAVTLARNWTNRPPISVHDFTVTQAAAIPDAGLRVVVTGAGGAVLASFPALGSSGLHVETQTDPLRLVDLGFGTNDPGYDLTDRSALIQRDAATFTPKINMAAQAGAQFAIVYNFATNTLGYGPPGGDYLVVMATDFAPIPAVFIGHNHGEALKELFRTNSAALAQIRLTSTNCVFRVPDTLLCEHVGLRVQTDHQRRGDLRVTLVSPSGTRSVLQQYGFDESPGPRDWTYWSTHHCYESSAGDWTAYFSDEFTGSTGSVLSATLVVHGVPLLDLDHDGLSDNWERLYLGGLQSVAGADPDRDGYSNAREQIMGSDPGTANNLPFSVDLMFWKPGIARLSWSSSPWNSYQVWGGTNPGSLNLLDYLSGKFYETEWFTPSNSPPAMFFRVNSTPNSSPAK